MTDSFKRKRPEEQVAVKTTIVGGRPPGSGRGHGNIPRGIEVLVKKAAVDPEFKKVLLERRAAAAGLIDLELEQAEVMMIQSVPVKQLEMIIANTEVPDSQRRAFLGKVAALMLAAIGVSAAGCDPATTVLRPDPPPQSAGVQPDHPEQMPVTDGIRPDPVPPPPVAEGIRPDIPEPHTRGVRPDRPLTKGHSAQRPPKD